MAEALYLTPPPPPLPLTCCVIPEGRWQSQCCVEALCIQAAQAFHLHLGHHPVRLQERGRGQAIGRHMLAVDREYVGSRRHMEGPSHHGSSCPLPLPPPPHRHGPVFAALGALGPARAQQCSQLRSPSLGFLLSLLPPLSPPWPRVYCPGGPWACAGPAGRPAPKPVPRGPAAGRVPRSSPSGSGAGGTTAAAARRGAARYLRYERGRRGLEDGRRSRRYVWA